MNFGIIAAGEGSRLAGEGITLPKPLVSINGEPMIGRLLRLFGEAGAEEVAVVSNADRHETAEYLARIAPALPFRLTVKEAVTPSSMHTFALLCQMLAGKGRFIATTVDTIFNPASFDDYVKAFANAPAQVDGIMAVTRFIDDEKPLYVAVDRDMDITAFLDKDDNPCYISAGVYGLDDKAVGILDRCLAEGVHRMRNFQRALVADGLRLKAFDIGKAIDVDHAGDLETAQYLAK